MERLTKISVWALGNPVKTIFIISVLIRLLIVVLYQHVTVYPDSADYLYLSERLSDVDLVGYQGQRSPGYPLLLTLVNNSFVLIAFVQLLLGVLTLIVFYKILLLLKIGAKTSLLASLLLACYIPTIFFELAILSETLTLFCIVAVFYAYLSSRKNANRIWILVLFSVFLVLIKPFYIFLPLVFFAVLLMQRRWKIALATALFPLIAFWGWSYLNEVNTGYFVPTTFYGFNLAQNCVSFAEYTSEQYAEIGLLYARYRDQNLVEGKGTAMSIWDAYPALMADTGLSFADLSALLYNYSRETIGLNLVPYLEQVAISWLDFWKTSMYVEYHSFSVAGADSVIKFVSHTERIVFQLVKIIFLLLIPYHLLKVTKNKKVTPLLLISIVVLTASVLQALITYGTNSRFSYPFETLMLVSILITVRDRRQIWKSKFVKEKS